jgi:hypothetical protein
MAFRVQETAWHVFFICSSGQHYYSFIKINFMTDHKKNQQSSGQGHRDHNKDRSDKHMGSDKHMDKNTNKHKMPSKQQEMSLGKKEMPDSDEEPVTEADPDIGKIQIDDDPEQTKKKIPHMKK